MESKENGRATGIRDYRRAKKGVEEGRVTKKPSDNCNTRIEGLLRLQRKLLRAESGKKKGEK